MSYRYRRAMLKLSGEALGKEGWLFDHALIGRVAEVLCRAVAGGVELGVVIGGGNLWRGRLGGTAGMDLVTADQMGMLGTVMNCLCMMDAVRRAGGDAVVLSAVDMPRICEGYRTELADSYLKKGRVVLFGGGLGSPCFTTDSAVVLRAAELRADAVLLAKNVDGIYTGDPKQDRGAELLKDISYQEAIDRRLKAMDTAAFSICVEQKLPVVRVFGLSDAENILRVLEGAAFGTILHP